MPCLWMHVGAFGELQAAMPLLNALRQRYPNFDIMISSTHPECQGATCIGHFKFLKILRRLWRKKPALLISYSFMVETRLLIACLLLRIPVVYLYEGFCGIRMLRGEPYYPGRKARSARLALWRVIGVVSQPDKQQEFEELGCPPERIRTLKSLKLI